MGIMESKLLSLPHCTQINISYQCSVEAQLPPFPRYAPFSHCTSLFPLLSSDFHISTWKSDSDSLLWPIRWSYGKRDFSKNLWHFVSLSPTLSCASIFPYDTQIHLGILHSIYFTPSCTVYPCIFTKYIDKDTNRWTATMKRAKCTQEKHGLRGICAVLGRCSRESDEPDLEVDCPAQGRLSPVVIS